MSSSTVTASTSSSLLLPTRCRSTTSRPAGDKVHGGIGQAGSEEEEVEFVLFVCNDAFDDLESLAANECLDRDFGGDEECS